MSRKAEKSSHDVWLAGLGALAVAEQEGSDLFQTLVKKGEEFEQKLINREGEGTVTIPPARNSASRLLLRGLVLDRKRAQRQRHERQRADGDRMPFRSGPKIDEASKEKRSEPRGSGVVAQLQARRFEAAQQEFLKEFGGAPSTSARRNWERWRREGKIFAVTDQQSTYVPSFQLDEKGRPRPVVARVIQVFGGTTSEWGLALWFTAANGWLDGKRPVDLLASAPEEVVEAAQREAEELVF